MIDYRPYLGREVTVRILDGSRPGHHLRQALLVHIEDDEAIIRLRHNGKIVKIVNRPFAAITTRVPLESLDIRQKAD